MVVNVQKHYGNTIVFEHLMPFWTILDNYYFYFFYNFGHGTIAFLDIHYNINLTYIILTLI